MYFNVYYVRRIFRYFSKWGDQLITEKEYELKVLLEEDNYNRLLQESTLIKQETFINHYFDSENSLLYKNGITLRIREFEENCELCVKQKKNIDKAGIISSNENKESLPKEKAFLYINNPNILSDYLNGTTLNSSFLEKLSYLGKVINERSTLEIINGLILELDKTIFPNKLITYELEIEGLNEISKNEIEEYLLINGIKLKPNLISKYSRFYQIIEEINKC